MPIQRFHLLIFYGEMFCELMITEGNEQKKGRASMTLPFPYSNFILIYFLNFLLSYSERNRSKNSNSFLIYRYLNEKNIFGI